MNRPGRPKLDSNDSTEFKTLRIPKKLYEAFKGECAARGWTFGEGVRILIKRFLREDEE